MNLVNIDRGATRAEGDGVGALQGLFAKFQLRHLFLDRHFRFPTVPLKTFSDQR